jgi:hypothetical protein
MAFENTIPEPKQYYLNLLIKLDFEVGQALYRYQNFGDAINGMQLIINQALAWDEPKLKEIVAKLDEYADRASAPLDELRPIFREIQKYLNDKWFSELRLGVVPTATVQGETALPKSQTFNPNQTSRLK